MVPNGWDIKKIGEIATVTSGGTPSRDINEYWVDGDIPWVRTTEVQNCILNMEDVHEYISELGLKNSSAKIFPRGTILLAMIGQGKTRGQVALLNFEAATNQNCAAIILKEGNCPNFYFNFLLSRYEQIRGASNSAGQSNLSGTLVKAIEVVVPPLAEQQKIAQILSTWDKAIAVTEQLLANSQQQKKALMQQLLTGKKRLLDENGARFEGEWEEFSLGNIAKVYQPKTISQSQLSFDGYPVYGANGIIGYYCDFNHELEQIAVTCRGSTCGVVNWTMPKSWITGNAMVINVDNNSAISKKFLFYVLSNADLKYLITGSGQPQITGDIKNHVVHLASFKEQKVIAQVLTIADQEIEVLQRKLDCLQQEKKALMQQLLTGKRRVKVAA